MSHISTVEVFVSDLAALKEACTERGWVFHEGKRTYRYYGQWVDDTPLPHGFFTEEEEYLRVLGMSKAERCRYMNERLGKCDHAISIPGCTYEIGVKARGDGTYTLVWDFWGSGGLMNALGGSSAPVLMQAYASAKVKAEVRALDYEVTSEEVLTDGTIRLRVLAGGRL